MPVISNQAFYFFDLASLLKAGVLFIALKALISVVYNFPGKLILDNAML
jgi:hypothetical protein